MAATSGPYAIGKPERVIIRRLGCKPTGLMLRPLYHDDPVPARRKEIALVWARPEDMPEAEDNARLLLVSRDLLDAAVEVLRETSAHMEGIWHDPAAPVSAMAFERLKTIVRRAGQVKLPA